LKLPAAERAGNLHRKEYHLFLICSLTPPQAAGNALAVSVQMLDNHPLPIKLENQDSSPWFFSYGFERRLARN
jgi:hypothetical protein